MTAFADALLDPEVVEIMGHLAEVLNGHENGKCFNALKLVVADFLMQAPEKGRQTGWLEFRLDVELTMRTLTEHAGRAN